MVTPPEFDLMQEIQNVCVKIPLFQAIRDIPIYAKILKEIYINKSRRKPQDPPTIDVIRRLADVVLGKTILPRYDDPSNPVISVHIYNISIPNTLIE